MNLEKERAEDKLFKSPVPRQKDLQPQEDKRMSSAAHVQVLELEKHVRELQARLLSVDQDNGILRASVDESDYWIYDRGPIQ